jgi:hypothetical protein
LGGKLVDLKVVQLQRGLSSDVEGKELEFSFRVKGVSGEVFMVENLAAIDNKQKLICEKFLDLLLGLASAPLLLVTGDKGKCNLLELLRVVISEKLDGLVYANVR